MLSKLEDRLHQTLATALVIGVCLGWNPVSCSAALAVLFAYRVAEKYFHRTSFDEDRLNVANLRAEVEKIKTKQSQADLKGALGGIRG